MATLKLKYRNRSEHTDVSSDWLSNFAIFMLFASLLYHAFFCFVNTNIFTIQASFLMLTEAGLLGIVILGMLTRRLSLPMLSLLIFIFANAFVLVIFQQYFDPKNIRNLIIPILMVWLGSQYNQKIPTNKLMSVFAIIVITVGLIEFLIPSLYQSIFDIMKYQVSIGRSTQVVEYAGGFSMNGTRWGGRHLLSFLGDHRTSSIFLETVNMGNFGVLLACWGLSRKDLKSGLMFVAVAMTVAILADSRFASTLIALMILLRLSLSVRLLELFSYFSPMLILMICFYLEDPAELDNFRSRLGTTGYFILNFKASELFGLSNFHYNKFVDQGYAYLFHFSGLLLALVLWVVFCRLPMMSKEGRIFKSLFGVLIAANLAISGDSVFSFKWVTVAWFLLGTLLIKGKAQDRTKKERFVV